MFLPLSARNSTLTEVSEGVSPPRQSDPVGTAARISFSQSPRPNKEFIAYSIIQQRIETVVTPLDRYAVQTSGWYGHYCWHAEASIEMCCRVDGGTDKLFVLTYNCANDPVETRFPQRRLLWKTEHRPR